MPSPFPGMDPYIEATRLWEDFHPKLIGEIESAAAAAVPERYLARLGERSYVVLASSQSLEPEKHMAQADRPCHRALDGLSVSWLQSRLADTQAE